MSKIIEALEKAKREGKLESTEVVLEERAHVVPLNREAVVGVEASVPSRNHRRSKSYSRETQSLDAGLLVGVDPRVAALHHPMSGVAEQYRHLRSRLERGELRNAVHTLAITSAVKGEGKSLTAVNLAVVMAQNANNSVLLVDADLRRPSVHRLLGVDLGLGLSDHIGGSGVPVEQVVRQLPFFGLSLVTAGTEQGHPGELLASPEFGDFVAFCRKKYDYVVIDTPPVHPISDVSFLTEFVDGVLLVVRAGRTARSAARKAADTLPPGKIVGTVLNRVDELGSGYAYSYGYGKGDYGYYAQY